MKIAELYCVSFIIFLSGKVSSICLFPPELEGEFIIQNAVVNNEGFKYSTVNITSDTLSPYGQCHSRNGSNVIVVLRFEDNECYRCFSLQMVSQNIILLIHNEENINSKCSSSAETVKCPEEIKLNDENQSDFHSIVLYRMSGREGSSRYEFCPFNFFDGEVKFDYFSNDEKVCTQNSLSQCPSGINLRFKGCSNGTFLQNTYFECIGHWKALNKNYLALIEWTDAKATYKCGTYNFENNGAAVTLEINNDCSSLSLSSKRKKLTSADKKNRQVFKIQVEQKSVHPAQLRYPSWLQGKWTNLEVHDGVLMYRDPSSFKFYRMTIIEQLTIVGQFSTEKYEVSSHSQCGEESYKCLAIRKLDANILEFQVIDKSESKTCNEENMENAWLTQARVGDDVIKTSCPISGKYLGYIPDKPELCAVMTSNCNSPDVMNFEIGLCGTSEIYEKRAYRCMGQWFDKEVPAVYTFTKRDDIVNTYECFVGLMTGSDEQIVIREAGKNCYKLDPLKYGMLMNQTEKCRKKAPFETVHEEQTIQYEVAYDDKSTMIDFSVETSTIVPNKTHKKQKNLDNDQLNETSGTATTRSLVFFNGFAVVIGYLLIS